MSPKSQTKGLIILVQDILGPIPDEDIIAVLPEEYNRLPRHTEHIVPEKIQHGEAMNHHWRSMLIEQERIYRTRIKPLLDEHPDYEVLYFGLAPIPLAIHLGYLITSFRGVKAYLRRQATTKGTENKNDPVWSWPRSKEAGRPNVNGIPKEYFNGAGDVVIRIGTRFKVNSNDTDEIVSKPIKEVEIFSPEISSDLFGSYGQMAEYASAFSDALDAISSNLPEVRDIHLFAAIPVGLAFLLGQKINPNAHPLIHIYEYDRDAPKPYHLVYTANEELNSGRLEISSAEQKTFNQIRKSLKDELNVYRERLEANLDNSKENWFESVVQEVGLGEELFRQEYWKNLSKLDPSRLKINFLDTPEMIEASEQENYYFTDRFMKVLSGMINSPDDQMLATRLFSIRETVHELSQGIRSERNPNLSMYPKVIEEADYQADVYALLHVFFCERHPYESASEQFAKMVEVLISIWWAFDCALGKTQRMEVQRVNRYLTWYYLLCSLESDMKRNLKQIIELLAHKPILELRLRALKVGSRERVEFDLKTYDERELGIALFYRGRMKIYHYSIGSVKISDLMEGLRDQDPDRVKDVLKALILETPS